MNNTYSNYEVMQLVGEIETSIPVETWLVGDVFIWPIVRNSLCFACMRKHQEAPVALKRESKAIKFIFAMGGLFKFIIKSSIKYLTTEKAYDSVFLSDGASKFSFDRMYDKFCDPLDDYLRQENPGHKALFFSQLTFTDPKLKKQYTSLEEGYDGVCYVARLYAKLFKPNATLKGFDKFVKILEEHDLHDKFSIHDLIVQTVIVKIFYYYFLFYINKKMIQQAYVVCYYGLLGYALSLACFKKNIQLSDLQHGTIANTPAYHLWKKIAPSGYTIIPTNFILWDQFSLKIFQLENHPLFLKNHTAEVFGLLALKSNKFHAFIKQQASKVKTIKTPFRVLIFVPLQPQFYGRRDWDRLAAEIKTCSEDWLWWLRPHPCYKDTFGMEEITQLNQKNIFIDDGSVSIYSILMNASATVTTASASIIEASHFNVPSFLISPTGLEDFGHYIKAGKAHFVPEHHSIVNTLKSFIN